MKYFVTVDGRQREVVLEERGGELEVTLDGEPVEIGYEEVDRLGQVALLFGDRSHAISIEEAGGEFSVTVEGHVYRVLVEDERERAAHAAEREGRRGGGDVRSLMPGIVIQVLVSEGEEVAAGQPLVILEAMKMQNEIEAPSAGRVTRVHVAPGEAVGSGAMLLTLQAE
ncbi:MAG: biotin/lipoyl-binding protein [Planctomycetota bacterium]|nr:biotin/lipoyl-binding protein [Planctomycetota bacterium]